ncbi:MAG TPA: hypothetical protein VH165_09545 [Kofleriaceae bacterium]|nr:hypothetical protein [Kofleriaceae bacterium]
MLDVQYEKAFETDVTERVLEAFAQHGVLPPAVLHRSIDARPRAEQQHGYIAGTGASAAGRS